MNKYFNITITNIFGGYNRGDQALVYELVNILDSLKSRKRISISGVVSIPESFDLEQVEVTERIGRSENKIFGILYNIIGYLSLIPYLGRLFFMFLPDSQQKSIINIKQTNLIISCPGGFLQDSNLSYFSNLLQLFFAIKYNKPFIIAPQSIGPIRSKIGQYLIKKVLNHAEAVFTRERISYKFINSLLSNNKNVFHTKDLALYIEPQIIHSDIINIKNTGNKLLGMTMVDWTFPESENPQEDRKNYVNEIYNISKRLESVYDIKIFNQVSKDYSIIKDVLAKKDTKQIKYESDEINFEELILRINKCEIFIGTRFHSCIFALINHIPTIAIAYLPKTNGIMKDLGLERFIHDIYSLNSDELIQDIYYIQDNYSEIKEELKVKLSKYREDNKFKSYLTEYIKKSEFHEYC